MKKAYFMRYIPCEAYALQALYRLDPPVTYLDSGNDEQVTTNYVYVSGVYLDASPSFMTVYEVMAFPSDAAGEVVDWGAPLSRGYNTTNHAIALDELDYAIVSHGVISKLYRLFLYIRSKELKLT